MANDTSKIYSDFATTVVRSNAQGHKVVHKFGRTTVGLTIGDVWNVGSDFITFPTSAFPVVAISSSTNDAVAGSGARVITIEGLNADFVEVTEHLAMNGQSLTDQTTNSFIRINRAFVEDAGTYSSTSSGANAGSITIQFSGSTVLQAIVDGTPSIGQTQNTLYTVPAGKTAYIQTATGNVDSAKTATIYAWQRQRADITVASSLISAKRNLFILNGVSGVNPLTSKFPFGGFPEKTDIWFSALGGVAGTDVEVDYELLVIDN